MWVGAKSQKDGGGGEVGGEKYCFLFLAWQATNKRKWTPFSLTQSADRQKREREGRGGGGGGAGRQAETKTDSDREKRGGVGLGRVGHEKKSGKKKKIRCGFSESVRAD